MINKSWTMVPKSMQNRSIFWKSDFSKNMFLARFYKVFWRFRVAKVDQKSIRNPSKIDGRKSHAKWTQNHQKWCQNGFKLVQNRSKIYQQIDSKIDAKFVVLKSIKNRALERQRVAKVTSIRQRSEVSGAQGSLYSQKVRPFDSKTATPEKGSRHARGPEARRI